MPVTLERKDGIARLQFNRPERHNAVDAATKDALVRHAEALERAGPDLRCVVISGAGRSFCSGADLDLLKTLTPEGARQFMVEAAGAFRRLEALAVPVIAAVKGYCLGGGFELLLHCDVAIAADDAQLGLPETTIGLVTTAGSVTRLMDAVGDRRARELLLTGRKWTAEEAFRAGLVAEVVPAVDLDRVVGERAARIAQMPTEGLAAMKALVHRARASAFSESFAAELDAFERLLRARNTS